MQYKMYCIHHDTLEVLSPFIFGGDDLKIRLTKQKKHEKFVVHRDPLMVPPVDEL